MISFWRRRAAAVALTCALAPLLAGACTSAPPPNTANAAQICDSMCKRLSDCKPGWDVGTCETSCRRDKLVPYYREDYVGAVAQCIQTSTCDVILHSLDRTCLQATRPGPSDIARQTCMTIVAKDHSCTGKPEELDDCLTKWRYGLLSDPVLSALASCQDMPCGNRRRRNCSNATLGISE
jgi:hypothetical protein